MIASENVSRTRTERLVNLVICLLSTRRFLTASQIAATVPGYEHDADDPKDHEAFQRKFERDKAELRELGVPLETGTSSILDAEPGYRIARRDYALPDIPLAPDEAAAVGIAARLWHHAGLAAAASSGLTKLRAAGIDVDPHATLGVEPVVTVDPAFEPMAGAVRDRCAVTFDYRTPEDDAAGTRRLQPWGVVCWRGRWYVVGHDLDRTPRLGIGHAAQDHHREDVAGSAVCGDERREKQRSFIHDCRHRRQREHARQRRGAGERDGDGHHAA